MKFSTEWPGDSQAVFTIEADSVEWDRSIEKAYHHLAKKVNAPGFRKGKTPKHVLERLIGKEAFVQEAIESLVPELYNSVLEESQVDAIAEPALEVTGTDPLTFKATVPLRPTVETKGYRDIRLPPETVDVSEQEIDNVIEHIRNREVVWDPVEREVRYDDMVVMAVAHGEEGNPATEYPEQVYIVEKDSKFPVKGFAEQLIGMKHGEEKEFGLSYKVESEPKDESESIEEDKSGDLETTPEKILHFKVKINEIKEKILPELDDDFAKTVGQDIETFDALRERVLTNLKVMAEEGAKRRFERKAIDAATATTEVQYPPILVDKEIESIIAKEEHRLGGGQKGKDTLLMTANQDEEGLREQLRPQATKNVIDMLVLGKIAREENIEVSDAEIDAEIEISALQAGERAEEIMQLGRLQNIRTNMHYELTMKKVAQLLVSIASSDSTAGDEDSQKEATEDSEDTSPSIDDPSTEQ